MRVSSVRFAEIKRAVSISQLLDRYGLLHQLRRSGQELSGPCPVHSGHNPTQFRVNLAKNCWICFGDCHCGGSVLDFVSRKEGVSLRDAARLIQKWFPLSANDYATVDTRGQLQSKRPRACLGNPVLRFRLWNLRYHPYLRERRITGVAIRTFGLGHCSIGCMSGRIVIPIHNREGKLVAYAGRWPGTPPDDLPKYKMPPGFRKSLELFNAHRAKAADRAAPLVVVEGFFDCIKLWQGGVRSVVALMGSSMSKTQENTICEIASGRPEVVLMLDEDEAGRAGRKQVGKRLEERRLTVRVHEFDSPGQQPDNLPSAEIKKLCLRHRP